MKEFFKMFFASFLAFGAVCVGAVLLMIMFVGVVSSLSEPEPVVEKSSVLVFDMNANIQDAPVSTTQQQIINDVMGQKGPKAYALRQLLRALDKAATDDDIKAIYLRGSLQSRNYSSGYATLKEVREAIEEFKTVSGKPVIAYLVYPTGKDLYVASTADTIYMNPEGLVANAGMAANPMFLAGLFKKYGIGVQITKAGEFKSAAEQLVLEKMSDPSRLQTEELLEDLWHYYSEVIAERTGMSLDEFQALIDEKGYLTAQAAHEAGVVDELAFIDTVIGALRDISDPEEETLKFKATQLATYIQTLDASSRSSDSHVAVVYAEGAIVHGEGEEGQIGGDSLSREIRKLRQDEDVKAIVLRVNSPGGSALASEVIQHELLLAQEKMPVVVSMGTVAASGGYWISTYADKIYAEPNTITGSIGVIGALMNFQGIANNHGISFDVVKTAKYADMQSPTRPKNEEEMALIQGIVDDIYGDFLRKVAEGRDQPVDAIAKIAEGRVWSGVDALGLGLVDELGGLEDAIAYAASEAGLGEDPAIRDYPKAKDFFEEFMKNISGQQSAKVAGVFGQEAIAAIEELKTVSQYNDPKGAYAILPFNLDIK